MPAAAANLEDIYQDFIMFQGDDRSVFVRVEYSDDSVVDLTGGSARLLVKENKTDSEQGARENPHCHGRAGTRGRRARR